MLEQITVVTAKRTFTVYALLVTAKQAASDPNNEWGVDRILVLNTTNPSNPPTPSQIAAMVFASDFKCIYRVAGMMI